jgi:hypothetical protein
LLNRQGLRRSVLDPIGGDVTGPNMTGCNVIERRGLLARRGAPDRHGALY